MSSDNILRLMNANANETTDDHSAQEMKRYRNDDDDDDDDDDGGGGGGGGTSNDGDLFDVCVYQFLFLFIPVHCC